MLNEEAMKYFWRIYGGAFLGIILIAFFWTALSPGLKFWWSGISFWVTTLFSFLFAVLVIPFVGLVAFSWGKPLGFPWVWKVVFWVVVLAQFVVMIRSISGENDVRFSERNDVFNPISILLELPFFIGLYLYAYRSPSIWKKQNE